MESYSNRDDIFNQNNVPNQTTVRKVQTGSSYNFVQHYGQSIVNWRPSYSSMWGLSAEEEIFRIIQSMEYHLKILDQESSHLREVTLKMIQLHSERMDEYHSENQRLQNEVNILTNKVNELEQALRSLSGTDL